MNEDKLNLRLVKPLGMLDEHFDQVIKIHEHNLAYDLFKKIDSGDWYTVKIDKLISPDFNPEFLSFSETVYIGKVRPLEMKYKPQPHLNWKERLKVLFTGHYPVGIGWE